MKKLKIFMVIALWLAMCSPGYANAPDVMTIIGNMKNAYESALEMAQQIEIQNKSGDEVISKMVAGKAQKRLPTGKHVMIVLLEPESLKGFAYLYREADDMSVESWVYPPAIQRLRKLTAEWNAYDSFLNTDFRYADLGFVDIKGEYRLLGEEKVNGTSAYKVQKIPESKVRYYSRIITWISKESHLPIRRDFYDIDNQLFKRQLFDNVIKIGETPVPSKISMANLKANTSTVMLVKELKTGLDMPDSIFAPERLQFSSTCPIWERVCQPSERVKKR